ncbi:MAG: BrnT family toxin [Bryobacteraceae bacterium]
MSLRRELHFEWDGAKALSNERKHGVAFTPALTIFRDPRIQTMFDEEHSDTEERWIALGLASNGVPRVVVHTWKEVDPTNVKVRIVSARRANATERAAYEERR